MAAMNQMPLEMLCREILIPQGIFKRKILNGGREGLSAFRWRRKAYEGDERE